MKLASIILLASSISLTSCAQIKGVFKAEKENYGGYLDQQADKFYFVANSQSMRILRAYGILLTIASIADDMGVSKSERNELAHRIRRSSVLIAEAGTCEEEEIKKMGLACSLTRACLKPVVNFTIQQSRHCPSMS